ncbi:acylneuraminate cytidylyltransferase family protein [Flavobacterium sp. SUN046]|uniref:acylneuraminate cytidylyltransferase family protein n=1 Tax=Flavobacterium sp. SUN046 TaxID=3002440 RepID=UPI002DBA79BB|nr:acylneuraminate cytidylyltransferase family protein [Flavobacterium sp. SUN046]MEC4050905.1 acylneuraminate cytidylyltransferase family protein [Flavobacterium sp. SUN046]
MKLKTIAVIPARGGSKRLPNKNILHLANLPLLAHTILYAKQQKAYIDEVYVSTDDAEIKKIAVEYGAIVIDRPAALSGDLEPTISCVQHVLDVLDTTVENVVLLQVTNPLRPNNLFFEAFTKFNTSLSDSLFTISRNHQKLGTIKDSQFLPFNYEIGQRSQDLEPLYFENGLLYITKAKTIQQGTIISQSAFPFVVDHPFTLVDIDTQEDFEYAEYLYHKYNL